MPSWTKTVYKGGEGEIVPVRITAVSDDGNLIGEEE